MTTRRQALHCLTAAALLPSAARAAHSDGEREADCPFCRIAAGEIEAAVVYRDRHVIAFAARNPRAPGHTLLVPRRHVRDLYALPADLAAKVYAVAPRLARALKRVFDADGLTCRQNNEDAGGQTVFHYHMHFIPRRDGDGVIVDPDVPELPIEERERLFAPLRRELS
jgi:histidine triad (HIT) family protein